MTDGGKYSASFKRVSGSPTTASGAALLASYMELTVGNNISVSGVVQPTRRYTLVFPIDSTTDTTPTVI